MCAVPGGIDRLSSQGCNRLIQQGAKLVTDGADVIDDLLTLNRMSLQDAVRHAGEMIIDACFWMSMGLVLIAVADVPLQRYQVHKRLKMTKQEEVNASTYNSVMELL